MHLFTLPSFIFLYLTHSLTHSLTTASSASASDVMWYRSKVSRHQTAVFRHSNIHILRLQPDEDLLESMIAYARVKELKATSVVSVVGSLHTTNIRYANESSAVRREGAFEIVGVAGNIDFQHHEDWESAHVHVAVADSTGATFGGHMMAGNLVFTTAEITMLEVVSGRFEREYDSPPEGSGYQELTVYEDL